MKTFDKLLKDYEPKARNFDLENSLPNVWFIYYERKLMLENADFIEEVETVFNQSKKAVQELKRRLLLDFSRRNDLSINDGRMTGYFLYSDLMHEAGKKLNQMKGQSDHDVSEFLEIFTNEGEREFKTIEAKFTGYNYINKNRFWMKTKKELSAFIQTLIDKELFRRQVKRKEIKSFFENRYKVELSQEFEPSRVKKDKVNLETMNKLIEL